MRPLFNVAVLIVCLTKVFGMDLTYNQFNQSRYQFQRSSLDGSQRTETTTVQQQHQQHSSNCTIKCTRPKLSPLGFFLHQSNVEFKKSNKNNSFNAKAENRIITLGGFNYSDSSVYAMSNLKQIGQSADQWESSSKIENSMISERPATARMEFQESSLERQRVLSRIEQDRLLERMRSTTPRMDLGALSQIRQQETLSISRIDQRKSLTKSESSTSKPVYIAGNKAYLAKLESEDQANLYLFFSRWTALRSQASAFEQNKLTTSTSRPSNIGFEQKDQERLYTFLSDYQRSKSRTEISEEKEQTTTEKPFRSRFDIESQDQDRLYLFLSKYGSDNQYTTTQKPFRYKASRVDLARLESEDQARLYLFFTKWNAVKLQSGAFDRFATTERSYINFDQSKSSEEKNWMKSSQFKSEESSVLPKTREFEKDDLLTLALLKIQYDQARKNTNKTKIVPEAEISWWSKQGSGMKTSLRFEPKKHERQRWGAYRTFDKDGNAIVLEQPNKIDFYTIIQNDKLIRTDHVETDRHGRKKASKVRWVTISPDDSSVLSKNASNINIFNVVSTP